MRIFSSGCACSFLSRASGLNKGWSAADELWLKNDPSAETREPVMILFPFRWKTDRCTMPGGIRPGLGSPEFVS